MTRKGIKIGLVFASICLVSVVPFEVSIEPPNDQRVHEGDTVVLDCSIPSNEDLGTAVLVFWYHDSTAVFIYSGNTVIPGIDDDNYELDKSVSMHWKLTIRQARVSDQGTWRCQLQGQEVFSQEVGLMVLAPPTITAVTPDLIPMPGSMVTLWCNATGSPEPTVTWSRQRPSSNLPSGLEFMTGNPLVIGEINGLWRGLYRCFITNGIGDSVTGAVFLQMEYAPEVTAKNSLVAVPLGDPAKLQCIGQSYPPVTSVDKVRWYNDGQLLGTGDEYQMKVALDTDADPYRETSLATLTVMSVSSDSLGLYTCRFESILGSDDATVTLEVGKRVDPDTGKTRSKAPTIPISMMTTMAAVTMATAMRW